MGFITRFLGIEAPAIRDPEDARWWGGVNPVSVAGPVVNAETALKASAVYACVALIAETIAAMPLITYRRLPSGDRERVPNHPLYSVLHDQPNRDQTAFEFWEMMLGHAMMRGNGYARKVPGPKGPVDKLVPMHPDRVIVERGMTGVLRYRVRREDGTEEVLNQEDVFHLKGKSSDGITGVSVLTYARDSIGMALATEEYGGRLFSQGTRLSGVLKTANKLDKDVQKRLKAQWASTYNGLQNAHQVAVLEQGLEWQQMGMTNEDAQFLDTRTFQVVEIARWFRVPPHMIGETSKSTSWGTGIEQMSIGFVVYTLLSWMTRIQQAVRRDLIIATDQYFAEFLVDALLRGDIKSRYEAYAIGRNWGWLSINDVRRMENQNSVANGDAYLEPLNMKEAGTLPPPSGATGAHYDLLVRDAAGRVARKEMAALTKLVEREAEDEAYAFYEELADFASKELRISPKRARDYANYQRTRIRYNGLKSVMESEEHAVEMLLAYVEDERNG
jgi:HK97 family phage portal protein